MNEVETRIFSLVRDDGWILERRLNVEYDGATSCRKLSDLFPSSNF